MGQWLYQTALHHVNQNDIKTRVAFVDRDFFTGVFMLGAAGM
jgi:hypothetical protein